jgi:hypothetical protein
MLDQRQTAHPFPFLAALLADPEFCEGLQDAPQMFIDFDESAATEAEMIAVVERNLTNSVRTRDRQFCQLTDTEPTSYLYALGFVLGMINEGCSHAQ